MTEKDIYTALGYLLTANPFINEIEGPVLDFQHHADLVWVDVYHYLKKLELPLELIIDLIVEDTICGCTHKDGNSDFDNLEIDYGTGRISYWCEPDGFRAYFDEIHKTWEPRYYSKEVPEAVKEICKKFEKAVDKCLKENK